MIEKKMIIGGEFVDKPEKIEVVYPYTREVIGRVPKGDEQDVLKAIEKAKEGFKKNSSLTASEHQGS